MRSLVKLLKTVVGTGGAPEASSASSVAGDDESQVLAQIAIARESGDLPGALRLANAAMASRNHDALIYFARGEVFFAWRRVLEAHEDFLKAEALGGNAPALFLHLGWTSFALGDSRAAETYFRRAIELDPTSHSAFVNLAYLLREQRRVDESIALFERALAIRPDDFEALTGIGSAWLRRRPDLAEPYLRRALDVGVEKSIALGHLGMSLALQDRHEEALQLFLEGARIEADGASDGEAFANVAIHLGDEGRTSESLAWFERGLRGHAGVHANLGYAHALLRAGRLREGWEQYEFRWMVEPGLSRRRTYGIPMWGGQDLRGKTILLCVEQGLGDTFQFVRYAPFLKALGATVVMMPGGILWNIAQRFPGVDRLVPNEASLPPLDYYAPLLSLPRIFGTDHDTIPPPIPFASGSEDEDRRWSASLGAKHPCIGLAWAGSPSHERDQYRSVSLAQLAPVLSVPGVEFVSLQKGPAAEHAREHGIADLGSELGDWTDTATLVRHLDLLITVDTAVAHLAATLGTPVWMLVPQPPDFRWLEARDDTRWYPTMRLFRQTARGQWAPVIERLQSALIEFRDAFDATPVPASAASTLQSMPWRAPESLSDLVPFGTGRALLSETRYGMLVYPTGREPQASGLRWYGEHLEQELDLCRLLVGSGATVMEVAAGIGEHALGLSAMVGATGRVFLHEADTLLAGMLKQNLRANASSNATIIAIETGAATTASAARGADRAYRLDDLQLARVDLIKVNRQEDVAGVIAGADDVLWRARPRLMLRSAVAEDSRPLARRLQGYGYRCWHADFWLFNAANFNRRNNDHYGRSLASVVAIPEEVEPAASMRAFAELT